MALSAAIAGFYLARQLDSSDSPLASGTWLNPPREVGAISLVDHTGKAFDRSRLGGQPTLVFFGFTHCPDICPTTLARLAEVKKAANLEDLRVLLVSVDPERDTPEKLAQYVNAFDPEFVGVTGSEEEIAKLTARFGVATARVELPGGGYTVDHSAVIFLLNSAGNIAGVFTPPFDTKAMAEDLRRAAPRLRT